MNESGAIKLCMTHNDPVGFEYLVSTYQTKAVYYALGMLGNLEDAKDACQEAFTKAFAAIGALKELPAFYPWFVTILRNCCLNMISRKRTSNRYQRETRISARENQSFDSPESRFLRNESDQAVWRCLLDLKSEHREILTLKYFQDCSYDTISKILEIPRGTVMSRLYAARKAFRDKYEDKD